MNKNVRSKMTYPKRILLNITVLGAIGMFAFAPTVQAATVKQQLNSAQNQLNQTRNQKVSLTADVANINAEIAALQAEIDATNQQIADTTQKIIENEAEMVRQKDILNEYLREMYLTGQVSLVEEIVKSKTFSDFVDQDEYLKTMQKKVKETTEKIAEMKKELQRQKSDLDAKKVLQERRQEQVNSQKAAVEQLLAQTMGEEARYQSLVSNLRTQQAQIEVEMARVAAQASRSAKAGVIGRVFTGSVKSYGQVKKGDVIGYQGNSGYSTGTHLHFEVRSGGTPIDPRPLIANGTLAHPMPGARVNQNFGNVGAVAGYSVHTGMDYSAGSGAAVHAAADGNIIARVTGQGNTYPGQVSYGNYVMIQHSNGLVSIYGHLQ